MNVVSKYALGCSVMAVGLVLTACQTVPTKSAVTPSNYDAPKHSDFSATDPDKIASVRTQMAAQLIREKKLDAAQRQLDRALKADKNYAPAYDMMGVLLQQEGSRLNLERADEYFRQAIALDPNFMQARNNYGVYLAKMGRNKAALAQFEVASAALGYEGRIGALENLGRIALKVGDEAVASKAFLRALDADPNSLIARIELVDLLYKSDRVIQAQKLYDETLFLLGEQAMNSPRIILQGVRLAQAQDNGTRAEELTQELFSKFPTSLEAKRLKSWLLNPNTVL